MSHTTAIALGIALLVSTGCAAHATPSPYAMGDWRRVTSLSAGTELRIWRIDPAKAAELPPDFRGPQPDWKIARHTGRLHVADAAGVSIEGEGGPLRIPREHVQRVEVITDRRRDSLTNGVLTGAMIGGLAGLHVTHETAKSSDPFGTAPIPIGVAIGAAIGSLVDAARAGPRVATIYIAGN